MPTKTDLYFILNPSLGIIKIGVAENVDVRRRTLECGCGVPLEVLHVVEGGWSYEKPLHAALAPSRLLGEWFTPTKDLLSLLNADDAKIAAFIERMRPHVMRWEAEAVERNAAHEAELVAIRELEKADRKRIKEEERKAKAIRDARAAKARATREANQRKRAEEIQRKAEEERPAMFARLTKPAALEAISARRVVLNTQRIKNAAMIGLDAIPYETQRGAMIGASEGT